MPPRRIDTIEQLTRLEARHDQVRVFESGRGVGFKSG